MDQEHTSILNRPFGYISKLVKIENTMLDSIKLKLSSNHLFNKLAKSVKQNNRPKDLRNIISRLI